MHFSSDTISVAIILIMCQHVCCFSQTNAEHEREKRFVFLKTAGMGYIAAIAIPISSVNRQRVYLATNFEAHYGLADADTFLAKFKMPFVGDDISVLKRDVHGVEISARADHFSNEQNAYTRKNFYRVLEKNIENHGYNGTACVLRTICETAEIPFYEYNGIFGNIFHILFSPSSSKAEKIRSIYYEAEYHGQQQDCYRYYEQCGISILDLISDIISVELHKMTG